MTWKLIIAHEDVLSSSLSFPDSTLRALTDLNTRLALARQLHEVRFLPSSPRLPNIAKENLMPQINVYAKTGDHPLE